MRPEQKKCVERVSIGVDESVTAAARLETKDDVSKHIWVSLRAEQAVAQVAQSERKGDSERSHININAGVAASAPPGDLGG